MHFLRQGAVRYTAPVRAEDMAAFLGRDWQAASESKDSHWLGQRRRGGVDWCLRIAEELRRAAMRQCVDWPSEEDRAADLENHVRVGAALRRVGRVGDL